LCIVVSNFIVDLEMHRVPLTNCPKIEHLSLHDLLATGCCLVSVSPVTSLTSNVCTALTTQNTKEHNCLIIQAQNAITFQPHIFLTGTHGLLVTRKEGSALLITNHCQGPVPVCGSVTSIIADPLIKI